MSDYPDAEDEEWMNAPLGSPPAKPRPNIGVGAPGWYALNRWGGELEHAFGATAYLVGSAAVGKQWRDVDVRVILSDEDFAALFGAVDQMNFNPRWAAYSAAFSAWGEKVTGLPIDFQVQPMSHANEHYNGVRCPLGIMPYRPYILEGVASNDELH